MKMAWHQERYIPLHSHFVPTIPEGLKPLNVLHESTYSFISLFNITMPTVHVLVHYSGDAICYETSGSVVCYMLVANLHLIASLYRR